MRAVLNFLFGGSDLPWGLQVFWKFLCWTMAALPLYVMYTQPKPADTFEHVVMYTLSVVFVLLGAFTKLGEPE